MTSQTAWTLFDFSVMDWCFGAVCFYLVTDVVDGKLVIQWGYLAAMLAFQVITELWRLSNRLSAGQSTR